jgi:hypothetical protein
MDVVQLTSQIKDVWALRQSYRKSKEAIVKQGKALVRWTCFPHPQEMDAKQREVARTTAATVFDYLCALHEYTIAESKGKAGRRKKPEVPDVDLILLAKAELELAPYVASWHALMTKQIETEKAAAKIVEQLPVWAWVDLAPAAKGFGAAGLSAIVGHCGDLSKYATPAKVWKRMGVALVEGEIQQRKTDSALGMLHGYSPERRSALWNIADGLRKAQVRAVKDDEGERLGSMAIGPVGQLYLDRKVYETAKNEAGDYAEQAAAIAGKIKSGKMRKHGDDADPAKLKVPAENLEGRLTKKHIDNRCMRYASKKFLKMLWQAWKEAAITTSEPKAIKPTISTLVLPDDPTLMAAE